MKSVALHNLGCKVNSYELDVMQQMLQENGYTIVPFDEIADIYIINTCTVTNIADRKSRQMLHRARQKNPDAVVVAVGCYVQTGLEMLEKEACVDLAIGNNRKKDLLPILTEYLKRREVEKGEAGTRAQGCVSDVLDIGRVHEYEEMTLRQTAEHTRAYIKIQDGCNQFCSYCVIPYARGRVRSRDRENILHEVEGMAAAGYKEVVLTGIHISSYGTDFEVDAGHAGGSGFASGEQLMGLIEAIHQVPGLERIRLGSLEPRIVTEETAARLAAMPKLCPHFHLSLQSGCDETLKRMNRHYTTGEYYKSVEALRRVFGSPAITTDVIVGFPGETEEEFAQTRDFLERVGFYEMHIFKYSRRSGTRAAGMPCQVPDKVKTERSNVLLEMKRCQSFEFRKRYIGGTAEVLLEEIKEIGGRKYCLGHTRDYVRAAVPISGERESLSLGRAECLKVIGFLTEEILLAKGNG